MRNYQKQSIKIIISLIYFLTFTLSAQAEFDFEEKDPFKINIPNKPDPNLTALMATLVPGSGYFYIGENLKGSLTLPLCVPMLLPAFIKTEENQTLNLLDGVSSLAYIYSIFDSYHSALDINGRKKMLMPIDHYSFLELLLAPFDSRSWTENNLSGYASIVLNIILPLLSVIVDIVVNGVGQISSTNILIALLFAAITSIQAGVFEEIYFRGTVQSSLSEITKIPWISNLATSTYFSFVHTTIAQKNAFPKTPFFTAIPFYLNSSVWEPGKTSNEEINNVSSEDDFRLLIAGTIISYSLGSLVENEKHGLLKAITHHTLRDFILLSSAFSKISANSNQKQAVANIQIPIINLKF